MGEVVIMTDENRHYDRVDMLTQGQILLENGFKIPVSIKDMSRRGAKLSIRQHVVLPTHFTVEIISPDGRKVKRCHCTRQWQNANEAGVHFLDSKTAQIA